MQARSIQVYQIPITSNKKEKGNKRRDMLETRSRPWTSELLSVCSQERLDYWPWSMRTHCFQDIESLSILMGESLSFARVTRRFIIIRPLVSILPNGEDRLLIKGGALVRCRDGLGRHGRQIATADCGGTARILGRSIQRIFFVKATTE